MDAESLKEFFAPFGAVEVKRLFSGHGIYADGLCFAVEMRGEIRLRGDASVAAQYEAAGARHWVYERENGRKGSMPYWTLPETAHDDSDELVQWCRIALSAARAAAAEKSGTPIKRRTVSNKK
ncbi:MAG: TfoX/Sxy family protein [Hyphomicrobiales bacterium]|nr:TfoX/Sxy family protein [Hyphomicrobiales bacterium]MDE2115095.1 TfoX/Sxy family protein [Hyphomicrobiales bacterium]